MMNSKVRIVVAAAADCERPFASVVTRLLIERGIDAWSPEADVLDGRVSGARMSSAVRDATALVIIKSAADDLEESMSLLRLASLPRPAGDRDLITILLPRGEVAVEAATSDRAVVLPADLDVMAVVELCKEAVTDNLSSPSCRSTALHGREATLPRAGTWSRVHKYEHTYSEHVGKVSALLKVGDYEAARAIYWEVLHYSGYREQWWQRLQLSQRFVAASKKVEDRRNAGLVLSKGVAYALISLKQYEPAMRTLKQAYGEFGAAHDARGYGVCWQYLGDIYAESGQTNLVLNAYGEAKQKLRHAERLQVELQERLYLTKSGDRQSSQRVSELLCLRNEFASLHDYREAVVLMEIARGLHALGSYDEALVHAREASRILGEVIGMPRYAKEAHELLTLIQSEIL